MSDFDALVKINIDDSELTNVEQRLQTLNGMKIPVDIDLSKAASSIQSQLNQIANGMKLQISNISLGNGNGVSNSAQKLGQQAGQTFSNAFVNNIDVKNAGSQIQSLQKTLKSYTFDTTSISNLTQNLTDMNLAVTEVKSNLKENGGLTVSVNGVDEMGRAVTVIKEFDSATGTFKRTGETIKQTFEDINQVTTQASQWQSKLESLKTQFKSMLDIGTESTNALKKSINQIDFTNISSQSELDNMIAKFKEAEAAAESLNSMMSKKWASNSIEQINKNIQDLPTAFVKAEESFKSLNMLGEEFGDTGTTIQATIDRLKQSLVDLYNADSPEAMIASYNEIAETMDKLQNVITETTAKQKNMFTDNDISSYISKLDNLEKNFKNLGTAGDEALLEIERLRTEISQLGTSDGTQEQITKYRNLGDQIDALSSKYSSLSAQATSAKRAQDLVTQKQTLSNRFEKWLNDNTKAVKTYKTEIEELRAAIDSADLSNITSVSKQITQFETMAKASGNAGNTWFTTLTNNMTKLSPMFGMGSLITSSISALKSMYNNVVAIDDAMTQLEIVTSATDSEMESFLESAISLSQELGQSVSDVLDSITTFTRLGYDLEDSSVLAEYSSILSNVAAVDLSDATTGLTSIIKGYGLDVSDAEHVADVLVEIGNSYAVSASEIIEAMEKSSAALSASGTSFEKSVALVAAGERNCLKDTEMYFYRTHLNALVA